jgi:quinoprotein glucose dehydrogenase
MPRQPLNPLLQPCLAAALWHCAGSAFGAGVEDAGARAALPEFKTIPAVADAEISPVAPVDWTPFSGWARSQGDNGSRRYSSLRQITRDNVANLSAAWTFRAGDGAANIQCTPVIVDGVLYAPTPGLALVAVDARTGAEKWRFQVPKPARMRLEDAVARRGLVYWPGDATHPGRLLFGSGDWIYAVDPATGRPLEHFGTEGRTPLPKGATISGVVYQNVYVVGGFRGGVFGYDVRDGKLLWEFSTVAKDPATGESWGPDSGSADCWGGISLDEKRGMVFVAVGAPRPDMVGTGRPGDNLYSNCVLALDAVSGAYRWHSQDVRHDLWDLDVCGPPNLVTVERNGRKIDVVTSLSKAGHLLLLERGTGKPVFPLRLRRAPVSRLPGEVTSAYQPDPELPEPISRMEFHPNMITKRTPEAQAFVKKVVEHSNYGFFQPFEEGKPTLFIGTRGGAEWSGGAVDVPSGRLYVTSNRWVSKIAVVASDEKERDPKQPPSPGESHYAAHCAVCHGAKREGLGVAPPLMGLKARMTNEDVLALLRTGKGLMPPNVVLNEKERSELLDYLFRRNQPASGSGEKSGTPSYGFGGFQFLVDHEGYPGIEPPWGLLNCYDLNTGRALWRVPLGELEELTAQGVPLTGSQNLGGATVTAGGLVFVAGTQDEKIRAFDAENGRQLWEAKLPFAGTSAPAVYEVDGKQFVVVTATGGGRVGGKSGPGDAYVAFSLP